MRGTLYPEDHPSGFFMTMDQNELKYLSRAFRLALKGRGSVSPNPRVGAVLVGREGEIIGEGFHHHYGGSHAEVNALMEAKRQGKSPKGATLFVTLEPCCHWGKTPPCTSALIESGISRVVTTHPDPNPLIDGKGFEELREAGIEVVYGFQVEQSLAINRGYLCAVILKRAWCTAKVALTLDGKLADAQGRSRWITGEKARRLAHQLRADHDAVLVGAQTVRSDDPELTVRMVKGPNPIRIVLSSRADLPPHSKLFHTTTSVPTILITPSGKENGAATLPTGVHHLSLPSRSLTSDEVDPMDLLQELPSRGVLSLLLEGGAKVLSSFLKVGLIDDLYVAYAPSVMGRGLSPFDHFTPASWEAKPRFRLVSLRRYGEDVVHRYWPIGGAWEVIRAAIYKRLDNLATGHPSFNPEQRVEG